MGDSSTRFWENTSINVVINVLRTVITALIGVLLVPFYIDELGMAAYGVIPLATATTSYIMIISDSLVSACSRYTVLAIQQDDASEISRTFNTAFVGIGRNALLLIPVMVLFSMASPYLFDVGNEYTLDVQLMFLGIMLSAAIVMFSSAFNSIFSAFNKLYILYSARILYTVSQAAVIFVMFTAGTPSLIDVGIAYVVSSLILFLVVYVYAMRLVGVKIDRSVYDPDTFRQMGSLGLWTIVLKMGTLLFIQVSLIMTNLYFGSEVEGGFAIVASLLSMVNTACYSMVAALAPLIFKHYANKDTDTLRRMMSLALKLVAFCFAFPVAFVMVFSPEILTAWVGSQYSYLSSLVCIAFIAELSFCMAAVLEDLPVVFLKVRQIGIATITFGAINILLSVLFVSVAGYDEHGVMAAWVLTTWGLNLFLFLYNARISEARYRDYMLPVIEGHIAMAVLICLFRFMSGYGLITGTWLSIIPMFFLMFMIYFGIALVLFFNKEERAFVSAAIPSSIRRFIPRFLLGQ